MAHPHKDTKMFKSSEIRVTSTSEGAEYDSMPEKGNIRHDVHDMSRMGKRQRAPSTCPPITSVVYSANDT